MTAGNVPQTCRFIPVQSQYQDDDEGDEENIHGGSEPGSLEETGGGVLTWDLNRHT